MRGPPQRAAPFRPQESADAQIRCSEDPFLTHLGSELRKLYAPLLVDDVPAAFTELLAKLEAGEKEKPLPDLTVLASTA